MNHIEIQQSFVDYRRLSDTAYQDSLSFGKALAGKFDSVAAFCNYPLQMTLPYQVNHLTFHFSAIDWAGPHKIKYSYLLERLEDQWSPSGSENKADYRNLPYGRFTFKVKAIGAAQVWSEVFEYTFTIRPPWWHTWWARSLYVLAGLFVIYVFLQWRTATLRKRQKVLEQTVRDRTAEVVHEKDRAENKGEIEMYFVDLD